MRVVAEPFSIQKRGNPAEQNDDATYPQSRVEYEQDKVCFAVADGATESVYARRWAEQLVNAVSDHALSPGNVSTAIAGLRTAWREWLAGQTLPWYTEAKAREGAFAALVVLELADSDIGDAREGRWHAAAVGDSCLFHVRGEQVLVRFPLGDPESFDNRPWLLGSLIPDNVVIHEKRDSWRAGDVFYLMTDALACWFIRHIDAGNSPSEVGGNISTAGSDAFGTWIESLRDSSSIRDDDCTFLRISIDG